uniref:Uncharacterized protein n=1 Tax=Anguilla anguilla TaxID=7936 RepID=A0A0E9SZC7_ANGAN
MYLLSAIGVRTELFTVMMRMYVGNFSLVWILQTALYQL